jgi:hypothetical protein
MFFNSFSRFNREKARRALLRNGSFTETQAEPILDTFETAHRRSRRRLLTWSDRQARLNAVPTDFYSEPDEKARLRAGLMAVGFTEEQAEAIVWVSWHGYGMDVYEPGELFTEGARALPVDRPVTDKGALRALSGRFETARSDEIRPRIRLDGLGKERALSAGGLDQWAHLLDRYFWHAIAACLMINALLLFASIATSST